MFYDISLVKEEINFVFLIYFCFLRDFYIIVWNLEII